MRLPALSLVCLCVYLWRPSKLDTSLQIPAMLEDILRHDLRGDRVPALLQSRALWAAAR